MKSPTAFRTISEVAEDLNVPQHVLRFWETRFTQIKPLKRQGGRRYYRPEDVRLLRGIRYLLYGEGYRIDGVQKLLKERGASFVSAAGDGGGAEAETPLRSGEDRVESLAAGAGEYGAATTAIVEEERVSIVAPASSVEMRQPSQIALSREHRRRLEAALATLDRMKRLLDQAADDTTSEPFDRS